jgi:hypothetical protein
VIEGSQVGTGSEWCDLVPSNCVPSPLVGLGNVCHGTTNCVPSPLVRLGNVCDGGTHRFREILKNGTYRTRM